MVRQSAPDSQTQAFHTREEVSQILKGVPSKKLLRALIASRIMWEPAEKAGSLVRDIGPMLETAGFDRVVILGLKPHDDGQTLMHPSNGCVRAGVMIFSDWSKAHEKTDSSLAK